MSLSTLPNVREDPRKIKGHGRRPKPQRRHRRGFKGRRLSVTTSGYEHNEHRRASRDLTRKDRNRQANRALQLLGQQKAPGLIQRVAELLITAFGGQLPSKRRLSCTRRAERIMLEKLSSGERNRTDDVKLGIQLARELLGKAYAILTAPRVPTTA